MQFLLQTKARKLCAHELCCKYCLLCWHCGSRSDKPVMLDGVIGSNKEKVAFAGWESMLPPSQGRCRCFDAGDKYVVYCMCFVLCLLYVMLSFRCIFVYSKQDPPVTFYRLLLEPAASNSSYKYLVWTCCHQHCCPSRKY